MSTGSAFAFHLRLLTQHLSPFLLSLKRRRHVAHFLVVHSVLIFLGALAILQILVFSLYSTWFSEAHSFFICFFIAHNFVSLDIRPRSVLAAICPLQQRQRHPSWFCAGPCCQQQMAFLCSIHNVLRVLTTHKWHSGPECVIYI